MASDSDNLVKRFRATIPGAEEELAKYLVKTLPRWITMSFSRIAPEDIEDLSSLLAIHILAKLDKFHGRSSFDTWARTVTRNSVKDWLAKEGRRRGHEIQVEDVDEALASVRRGVLPSRMLNPREELDRKMARELAMECLERVKNPRQKLILKEHFVGGLSVAEIAERWGVIRRNKLDVLLSQALQAYFKIVKEMRSEGRLEKCSPRVLWK